MQELFGWIAITLSVVLLVFLGVAIIFDSFWDEWW